jgi:hypothetical protein
VDKAIIDLGLKSNAPITDVWTGKDLGRISRVHLTLAPHACVLLTSR